MDTSVLINARTFLGNVWKLSAPYWRSEEKWRARVLLAAIVTLSLSTVYLLVLLNDWNRQFFNALEQKDERDFFVLLVYFCYIASLYIGAVVYETYLEQMLQMRWRVAQGGVLVRQRLQPDRRPRPQLRRVGRGLKKRSLT